MLTQLLSTYRNLVRTKLPRMGNKNTENHEMDIVDKVLHKMGSKSKCPQVTTSQVRIGMFHYVIVYKNDKEALFSRL